MRFRTAQETAKVYGLTDATPAEVAQIRRETELSTTQEAMDKLREDGIVGAVIVLPALGLRLTYDGGPCKRVSMQPTPLCTDPEQVRKHRIGTDGSCHTCAMAQPDPALEN